jgi:hypothetical protein
VSPSRPRSPDRLSRLFSSFAFSAREGCVQPATRERKRETRNDGTSDPHEREQEEEPAGLLLLLVVAGVSVTPRSPCGNLALVQEYDSVAYDVSPIQNESVPKQNSVKRKSCILQRVEQRREVYLLCLAKNDTQTAVDSDPLCGAMTEQRREREQSRRFPWLSHQGRKRPTAPSPRAEERSREREREMRTARRER